MPLPMASRGRPMLLLACMAMGTSAIAQDAAQATDARCTTDRLVGTWERVSLLRNALSVQPPDAPLFVKFGADGYWSMMEMPDRPKVDKPLEKQSAKELWSRFERVEGGQGTWTMTADGSVVTRRHLVNIAPGGENSAQDRLCTFEGEILALVGTGATRSPQARFRRLAPQSLGSKTLVGTWERTALVVDGKPSPSAPLVLILGEDGWFSETQLPAGRKSPGKPLEQFAVEDYLGSYAGVAAGRGTYRIDGDTFARKYAASVDPAVIGTEVVRKFSVAGDELTVRGPQSSGTFRRLKPLATIAP